MQTWIWHIFCQGDEQERVVYEGIDSSFPLRGTTTLKFTSIHTETLKAYFASVPSCRVPFTIWVMPEE